MLKKVQDAIEKEMARTNVMGTEKVHIAICLTDEDIKTFKDDMDYESSNYYWELDLDSKMLYMSYSEIDMKKTRFDFIETNDGSVIFVQYTNNRRNKVCYLYDFRDNYSDAFKAIESIESGGEFPYTDWDNNQLDGIKDFEELFPQAELHTGWDFVFDDIIGWLFYSMNAINSKFYRWWKTCDFTGGESDGR